MRLFRRLTYWKRKAEFLERLVWTLTEELKMADEVRTEMTKAHLSGDFKLPWTIPAGVHDDNNTGMRFEFLHGDDGSPILHVFSNARDKFLRVLFGSEGVIASDVRPFPDPGEANLQKQLAQAQQNEAAVVALDHAPVAGKDYHD